MDEEKLILCVMKYPEIYDPNNPHYAIHQVKETMWKEISEAMGVPVHPCKDKWKLLRDSFHRNLKRRFSSRKTDIRAWKYESQMSFLIPHFRERNIKAKAGETTSDDDNESLSSILPTTCIVIDEESHSTTDNKLVIDSPDTSPTRSTTPLRAEPRASRSSTTPLRRRRAVNKKRNTVNQSGINHGSLNKKSCNWQQQNPLASFFKAMADTVQRLPVDLQLKVKNKVYNAVSEAEQEYLTSAENSMF